MQVGPHAKLVPLVQAAPACHAAPAAHLRWQIFPRHAGLEHEQDAGQRRTVRHRRTATFGTRPDRGQQRRDVRPEVIRHERLGHAHQIGMDLLWFQVLLGALNTVSPDINPNRMTQVRIEPV